MPEAVRDENVRINGQIPAMVAGVRLVRGATHIYEVPAGTYHLEAVWKKQ
jgi:hypothetical protein